MAEFAGQFLSAPVHVGHLAPHPVVHRTWRSTLRESKACRSQVSRAHGRRDDSRRHRRGIPAPRSRSGIIGGMSVLRFDNVSKQYAGGHQALVDVSFEVAAGEMLFVTGHSGAGKSTLLKLIHLSERPTRGAVMFGERNLLKVRGGKVALHRREVGAVYQDHRLLVDRTIGENVALPLILRGDRRADTGKRVRSVLERVGLGHREKALPTELSAGEQQRVGIARAIVAEPRLLVADEPTGNLDPTLAAEIMSLFAELPSRGTSVLVVSHDLALIKQMRKRVLILDHGKLADDISPHELAE